MIPTETILREIEEIQKLYAQAESMRNVADRRLQKLKNNLE